MKHLFHLWMSLKILSQYTLGSSSETIHEQPPLLHHCWMCDLSTVASAELWPAGLPKSVPPHVLHSHLSLIWHAAFTMLLTFFCINLWWTLIVVECFSHKNRLTQWTSSQVKVSNVSTSTHPLNSIWLLYRIPWIASDSSTIYCVFPILHVLHPTQK